MPPNAFGPWPNPANGGRGLLTLGALLDRAFLIASNLSSMASSMSSFKPLNCFFCLFPSFFFLLLISPSLSLDDALFLQPE
jgi:hypothetical protein